MRPSHHCRSVAYQLGQVASTANGANVISAHSSPTHWPSTRRDLERSSVRGSVRGCEDRSLSSSLGDQDAVVTIHRIIHCKSLPLVSEDRTRRVVITGRAVDLRCTSTEATTSPSTSSARKLAPP